MVTCFYGWEILTQGLHDAIFNSFKHCISRYKVVLIYHVISKDHVFNGFSGFIGKYHLASNDLSVFDGERPSVVNIQRILSVA